MVTFNRKVTFRWMSAEVQNFWNPQTEEINVIQLAECCADQFDIYEDEDCYTVPEALVEQAHLVAAGFKG